ncbi:hypothetical protein N5C46_16490 [Rossellomorea vietnamensis]|uniref:Uncharacterized protein n=1 Tax=Rossellomorea vietnamensis TaxID=218284 RepID=A0ACD4C3S7_9BACI|nr:hypothetical protein [Rossellomorea vietnamensis]UXH43278.1 hypothetical protein N5C46_16490 [Rossellomorea vietnamensis]
MIFDHYDLLELFEREPLEYRSDQGFYMNSKTDPLGIKLLFSMSIYTDKCMVSLIYKEHELTLVSLEINNVIKVEKREDLLFIHSKSASSPIIINFKPRFSISEICL